MELLQNVQIDRPNTEKISDLGVPSLNDKQRKLVQKYLNLVHFCIQRFINPYNGARKIDYDELLSEGYLALCVAAQSFKKGKSSFSTYAVRVIKNHLINYITFRTEKLPNTPVDEENKSPDVPDTINPSPDTVLFRKEISMYIESAIKKLTPIEQKVIRLMYFDGLSIRATKERLKYSHEYIRYLHNKAIKKLKSLLTETMNKEEL